MGKRFWSLALSMALIGGVFSVLPAHAQTEPGATGGVVPASPNIVDPGGDANMHSAVTGQGTGITQTGADILAVWFTNDETNLYAHIQTTTGVRAESLTFITYVGPAAGTDCMQLRMTTEGEGVEPFSSISLSGDCGTGVTPYGPLLEEVGPEDTSILTGTFPLADVQKVATTGLLAEPDALVGYNLRQASARAGIIDDTDVGANYQISSGGPAAGNPSEPTEPPGKSDPPGKGKKKGCPKGKGQKKGSCPGKKKPKPPVASCPAYVPGEEGAEAETTVVTAAATEEKPVEVAITAPPGVPEVALGHVFQNIQVDADAADAGLYVRYEFPVYEDHDIYLNYADGSEAAHAGGFNPAPVPVALGCCDGTGTGGHSEQGAEVLDGIRTADCAGYTLDMAAFLSEGGEMTLKLWLGEAQYDPAAPAAAGLTAADMFFDLLGARNPLG